MLVRVLILFVLFALAGSVVSGTPLHSRNDKMMKCCDKARSKDHSPAAGSARLCCAVNCNELTPTPSGVSFNFSPSNKSVSQSIADQIAALFSTKEGQTSKSPLFLRVVPARTFQPRYIQHNSFLI